MTDDLNGMAVFVAVANAKGFTAAARELGVSASAVSQAIRKLEAQLGITLLQRSTRSVRLTEAGERLYATVAPALADVRTAVAALGEMSVGAARHRPPARLHGRGRLPARAARRGVPRQRTRTSGSRSR